jgi:hypothetical protein
VVAINKHGIGEFSPTVMYNPLQMAVDGTLKAAKIAQEAASESIQVAIGAAQQTQHARKRIAANRNKWLEASDFVQMANDHSERAHKAFEKLRMLVCTTLKPDVPKLCQITSSAKKIVGTIGQVVIKAAQVGQPFSMFHQHVNCCC